MLKYKGRAIVPGMTLIINGTEYPVVPSTSMSYQIGLLWENQTYNYNEDHILKFLEQNDSKILGNSTHKYNIKRKILHYDKEVTI